MMKFLQLKVISTITLDFWNMVKGQGLLFVLILGLAIWQGISNYQKDKKIEKLSIKVDRCVNEKFSILLEISQNNNLAINKNNEVLGRNNELFEELLAKK